MHTCASYKKQKCTVCITERYFACGEDSLRECEVDSLSSAHRATSKRLRNYDARCCIIITERYRSGHNGADSKSVCAQAHEGSNPSLSANAKHTERCAFCVGGERGLIRTFFALHSKAKRGFAFEPKAVWELAHKRLGEKFSRRRVPLSFN